MANVWWNDRELRRAVRAWEGESLRAGAAHLNNGIRQSISVQGVPIDRRSYPGEPPRRETGDLIRSWTFSPLYVLPSGAEIVVYSSLDYSYYLEIGADGTFGRIEARPYVARALLSEAAALHALMTPPLP